MEILAIGFLSLVLFTITDVQAAPTLAARVAVLENNTKAGQFTDVDIEANMASLAERVELVFAQVASVKASTQNLKTQLNKVTKELRRVQRERDTYRKSLQKLRGELNLSCCGMRQKAKETDVNETSPTTATTASMTTATTATTTYRGTPAASTDPSPNNTVPQTAVTTQDLQASTADASENLTPSKAVPSAPVTTQDSDAYATTSPERNRDLWSASKDGDLERVERILAAGHVNINTRGVYSRTPVMIAAWWGHRDVVEFVVGRGADLSLVDGGGDNVLHYASMGGDLETVRLILSLNKVDVNARNNEGLTPADMARYQGRQPVVELLVSRGAQ